MPAIVNIKIQQGLLTLIGASTDQLVFGVPVALSIDNPGSASISFPSWSFSDKPENSTATLSTPSTAVSGFTPDAYGTYLVHLNVIVNGTAMSLQVGAAVKTANLHYRIPATTESDEFDLITGGGTYTQPEHGWGPAIKTALQVIDDGYGAAVYGSGADGYVAYWNGTKTLTGSPDLTFDDTFFGVGSSAHHVDSIFWGEVGILDNIDTFGPSGMGIGGINATSINIGQSSILTSVLGNFVVGGTIDRNVAGSLNIGPTNATGGTIGKGLTTGTFNWGINGAVVYSQDGTKSVNVSNANGISITGQTTVNGDGYITGNAIIDGYANVQGILYLDNALYYSSNSPSGFVIDATPTSLTKVVTIGSTTTQVSVYPPTRFNNGIDNLSNSVFNIGTTIATGFSLGNGSGTATSNITSGSAALNIQAGTASTWDSHNGTIYATMLDTTTTGTLSIGTTNANSTIIGYVTNLGTSINIYSGNGNIGSGPAGIVSVNLGAGGDSSGSIGGVGGTFAIYGGGGGSGDATHPGGNGGGIFANLGAGGFDAGGGPGNGAEVAISAGNGGDSGSDAYGGTGGSVAYAAGAGGYGGGIGGAFSIYSGLGGIQDGYHWGGNGGLLTIHANEGGNGSASLASGRGGNIISTAGNAGAANGGPGNNGGDYTIDAGAKSGTGTDGVIYIGVTNASIINIGRASKTINLISNVAPFTILQDGIDANQIDGLVLENTTAAIPISVIAQPTHSSQEFSPMLWLKGNVYHTAASEVAGWGMQTQAFNPNIVNEPVSVLQFYTDFGGVQSPVAQMTAQEGFNGVYFGATDNFVLFDNGNNAVSLWTNDVNQELTATSNGVSITHDLTIGGDGYFNGATNTFAGNVVPAINDAYSLGSNSNKWHDGYFNGTIIVPTVSTPGTLTLTGNGGSITQNGNTTTLVGGTLVFGFGSGPVINSAGSYDITLGNAGQAILPNGDNVENFGSSSIRWRDGYFAGTTTTNALAVDGYTINPANARIGQSLVYNGTAFASTSPSIIPWKQDVAWSTIWEQIQTTLDGYNGATVYLTSNGTSNPWVVTPGTYDLQNVTFATANNTHFGALEFQTNAVINDLVTFGYVFVKFDGYNFASGSNPSVSVYDGAFVELQDNVLVGSGLAGFSIFMSGQSFIGTNSLGTAFTLNSGGQFTISAVGGATISYNGGTLFSMVSGSGTLVYTVDSSTAINGNPNLGGGIAVNTFTQGSAFRLPYTPTTPSNWLSVPNNVGTALDDLASNTAASVSDFHLTTISPTVVATNTPSIHTNYIVNIYYRVVTAATDITITLTWTDGSGAQSLTLVSLIGQPVGSYTFSPTYINATASAITVTATAGTANNVYVSASIMRN